MIDVVDDSKLIGGDWNMTGWHDFPIILGMENHPNWRTPSFFKGVLVGQPPTSIVSPRYDRLIDSLSSGEQTWERRNSYHSWENLWQVSLTGGFQIARTDCGWRLWKQMWNREILGRFQEQIFGCSIGGGVTCRYMTLGIWIPKMQISSPS